LSWGYLKCIFKDDECLNIIISIVNACIEVGHWPSHFKKSTTVVIPKPNKKSYNSPKAIVLLNIVGKLIEKVIGEHLQFHVASNNFIYPCQLGGLKFKSTIDVGITLTYIICSGWVKNLFTSTLVFDIAQFFPSLNHCLLFCIIKKAGFDNQIVLFFSNYLVNRRTNYYWNNFMSSIFDVNVGVGQGSALSPILSALYLSSLIYILEKCLKILKIPISIISFVNDGLFISQSKSFDISNSCLFYSYNILFNLLKKFSLVVEHFKTEIFHFNRSCGTFNPPLLNLSPLGSNILHLNGTWKYLGFIFDRKLTFHQHVNFYANKSILTVKCMKIISHSNHGINLFQKCLLYRSCILSIILYSFQLWFYKHMPMSYHLKTLGKIQRQAAIWILGAFKMSSLYNIKAIAGLVPIHLHLLKLDGRSQLCTNKLPPSHLIQSLIKLYLNTNSCFDAVSLNSLTNRQRALVKSHLIDSANIFNECLPSFDSLNPEFSPGL